MHCKNTNPCLSHFSWQLSYVLNSTPRLYRTTWFKLSVHIKASKGVFYYSTISSVALALSIGRCSRLGEGQRVEIKTQWKRGWKHVVWCQMMIIFERKICVMPGFEPQISSFSFWRIVIWCCILRILDWNMNERGLFLSWYKCFGGLIVDTGS